MSSQGATPSNSEVSGVIRVCHTFHHPRQSAPHLNGDSRLYRSRDRPRRITLIDLLPIDENRIHCYQDSHLIVDFQSETVRLDGQPVLLTHKEFALLAFLTRRAGELVSRTALLTQVWGYRIEVRTRTLDLHLRRLPLGLGRYGKL